MADSLNPDEARQRLQAVLQGRHVPDATCDLATAKARLREADPGIDIAPTLRFVAERRWQAALLSLLPWVASPHGRSYLAPLLLTVLDGVHRALLLLAKPRHAESAPDSRTADEETA